MEIIERLKKYFIESGLTQNEAAKKIGLQPVTLNRLLLSKNKNVVSSAYEIILNEFLTKEGY